MPLADRLSLEFVLYLIGYGISVTAQLGFLAMFYRLFDVPGPWAYLLAATAACILAFLYLRYVVYTQAAGGLGTLLFKTMLVSTGFRLIEWGLFSLAYTLSDVHYLLLAATIIVSLFLLKFIAYRRWVFQRR